MVEADVSLLVRLWVEMSMLIIYWLKLTSASLWGCELKFLRKKGGLQAEWSASLWGCELKSSQNTAKSQEFGQPPCEAVSWNCWDIYQATPDIPSASLWGCELTYWFWSSSGWICRQPPCEAVSWNTYPVLCIVFINCQPPCEAVSWNIVFRDECRNQSVSLLVRLWVEMTFVRFLQLSE